MTSIWLESLGRTFDEALDLLAAAVRDCTDDLWEASMWEVPADVFGAEPLGPDGKPVTDPAARHALAQRRSTPWSVAWHAREGRDEAVRMAAQEAAELAADYALRGADAVYVAVARRHNYTLVSLDREQRERAAAIVTGMCQAV
jgi:hypothetical protein